MTDIVEPIEAACPACGNHVAVEFFDGGEQPLATLAWPKSSEEAEALPSFPLEFVRCVRCGHVFNKAFDYRNVPYSDKPNLMFNRGMAWSRHFEALQDRILSHVSASPTVVEIGHGDGSFLYALAEKCPAGRFVGFDPHGNHELMQEVELRASLFDPVVHLAELSPDVIVTRHVLEHLTNPLGFLQRLSYVASAMGQSPVVCIEVPCIDQAISGGRTVDFYYEHNSQFTTASFETMLTSSVSEVIDIFHGYGREVIVGFARLGDGGGQLDVAAESAGFLENTTRAVTSIHGQLEGLLRDGKTVAVWGGTGKSAAFMCRYGMDRERFPWVVDSDRSKAGTFVPGTGQEIRWRDWLLENDVDVVIIPPQWRAADIAAEMQSIGVQPAQVLIEHDGRLIDYFADEHPYRAAYADTPRG